MNLLPGSKFFPLRVDCKGWIFQESKQEVTKIVSLWETMEIYGGEPVQLYFNT